MTYDEILVAVQTAHLTIFGCTSQNGKTIVLLGPDEPGFWEHITATPEWTDGKPDPMDRWSRRVIDRLAQQLGAQPQYPFGQTPPAPFLTWAMDSDQAWQSPVGMLVQAQSGLFVSYRGALEFDGAIISPSATNPCTPCAQPCNTACPVGALTAHGYDVPACRAYLKTDAGADCLNGGCLVRRSCPVSKTYARDPAQSGYHMRRFLT